MRRIKLLADFDMVEALAALQRPPKRARGARPLPAWRRMQIAGREVPGQPKRVLKGQAEEVKRRRAIQRERDRKRRRPDGKGRVYGNGRVGPHKGKYASEALKHPRRIDAVLVAFEPGRWFRPIELAKRAQRASLGFPDIGKVERKPVEITRLEKWWGLVESRPGTVKRLWHDWESPCNVYRLTPAGEMWRAWIIDRFGIELMEMQKPPGARSGG